MREGTVRLRVSANAEYRLVVVGTAPAAGARFWVRDAGGEFREVTAGSAVTVARDRAASDWVEEVRYRAEPLNPAEGSDALPMRYEIRVEPTI